MVSLLWNFYQEVIVYNPIADIEKTERVLENRIGTVAAFKPAWGKEIIEKNLFSPLRGHEPPAEPVEPVEAVEIPPPKRPELKLDGIILNQFGEYIAYIKKNHEKTVPLRKGDKFGDILVVDIKEREVELLWNGEKIILEMKTTRTLR
jgi:hypothetical protein